MTTSTNSAAATGLPKNLASLQHKMSAVLGAQQVVEILADETINRRGCQMADSIKRSRPDLKGYIVLVMNEAEAGAIEYAIAHLAEAVRDAYEAFFGVIEEAETPS